MWGMVRAGRCFGAFLVLVAACVGARAQEPALPAGPLNIQPKQQRVAPAHKPKPSAKPAAKAAKAKPVSKMLDPEPVAQIPETRPAPPKATPVSEKPVEKSAPPETRPAAEARPPFDEYVIAQFCTALSSAASDGRLAWQAKRLEEMEARLRERIAELEAKRAESADWLKRREEALRKADETVVAIYSKMKPDAVAAQFSAMDESGAAAILSKLNPRQAGVVLNEIDASRAARIAAEMAGVGRPRDIARSAP